MTLANFILLEAAAMNQAAPLLFNFLDDNKVIIMLTDSLYLTDSNVKYVKFSYHEHVKVSEFTCEGPNYRIIMFNFQVQQLTGLQLLSVLKSSLFAT